ncbi:MAG: protease complex subunit PrcB family protein [Bacillota bacterium]
MGGRGLYQFPGHPEADDAAYSLARCYEIEGRWVEALNALQGALALPDGDMRYHAAGRIIYILDVRMTREQLEELPQTDLSPSLRPLLDYTLAVREIRRDNFREAALALAEFLRKYGESETRDLPPLGPLYTARKYDFRGAVEKQIGRVNELAGLRDQWEKSRDPARLYALAAAIYHDQMLYYNHLWAGHRQWYNWLGYINDTAHGRAPAEMAAFAREMINYNHCPGYFQQVYENTSASPELRAKALYSTGLSYIGIDQWGQDAWFGFSRTGVKQKITAVYQQFIKEHPGSSLLDGALLALGAYTGEAGYLEKIIRDYPEGEMAEKARKLLEEMKSPHYIHSGGLYESPVPFKILSGGNQIDQEFNLSAHGDLPENVQNWAVSSSRNQLAGSMTYGEWTYILIVTGERPTAGYEVEITNISDNGSGQLNVRYRIAGPKPGQAVAQIITRPYILARIPASSSVVEFVEEN